MQYQTREISAEIEKPVSKFSIIGILGPRQSGKTTLLRNTFANYSCVSLEDPDTLDFSLSDPNPF